MADLDDPALKDRIAGLKSIRDQAQADAERTAAVLESAGQQTITPAMVRKFAATARERIRIAGGGYRRDHLRALAQRVEVADGEVRIMGSKSDLLRTLAAASGVKSASLGVRSSVPKWRPVRDSNSCYRRERAVSWASRRTGQAVAANVSVGPAVGSGPSPNGQALSPTRRQAIAPSATTKHGVTEPFHSSARKCPARSSGAPSARASSASASSPIPRPEHHRLQPRAAHLPLDERADRGSLPPDPISANHAGPMEHKHRLLVAGTKRSQTFKLPSQIRVAPPTANEPSTVRSAALGQGRRRRQPFIQKSSEIVNSFGLQREAGRHGMAAAGLEDTGPSRGDHRAHPGPVPAPSDPNLCRGRRRCRRHRPAG